MKEKKLAALFFLWLTRLEMDYILQCGVALRGGEELIYFYVAVGKFHFFGIIYISGPGHNTILFVSEKPQDLIDKILIHYQIIGIV